jgi:cell wall assembly regulator SMI1
MSDVTELLEDIRLHLERLKRPIMSLLKPGLDSEAIRKHLSKVSVLLPEVVVELYSWRNGTADTSAALNDIRLFPGYYFCSLEEAVSHYLSSTRHNPVWNCNWFPLFCSGGGDYYAISCKDTPSADGEVIGYFRDASEYPVEYEGLVTMLRTLDACFSAGGIVLRDGRLAWDLAEQARIAQLYNPNIQYWREC